MRLRSYKVPVWADKLIRTISAEEGIRPPRVVWMKRRDRLYSSGRAGPHEVRIVAGNNRKDQKEVVLHEMVHVIFGKSGRYGGCTSHGPEFYAKLYEIGKRHRVGAAYIKQRESWYKPRGVKAGYRLYLKNLRSQ